jgi:uncharacterized protein (DUF983 family)
MVVRALALRCPWCGHRRTFLRGWFRRFDRCRTCGIRWRREEGSELGAVAINTVITFGAIAVLMTAGFIATAPDIPVLPFVLALAVVGGGLPVIAYPFSYTVWLAFDLAVHKPDRAELDAAAVAIELGNTTS